MCTRYAIWVFTHEVRFTNSMCRCVCGAVWYGWQHVEYQRVCVCTESICVRISVCVCRVSAHMCEMRLSVRVCGVNV